MDGFIGLGSNLGDRQAFLAAGLEALERRGLPVRAVSSVWESEPVDTDSSDWFLNMVVKIESDRPPLEVLERLLAIEEDLGRRRSVRNAPRTLDLDLLLLGDQVSNDGRLQLPHPRMWQRRFVLEPLCEIAPRLQNPGTGRTVTEERARVRDPAVVRRLGDLASLGAHTL